MTLSIDHLNKSFAGLPALQHINLTVDSSEFVCLLGPSGCGKTTLLRIIAGLLTSDSGQISLNGKDLANLPARERGFGIVFQSYSLFSHMTVADNIAYGLTIRNTPRPDIAERVQSLLDIVRLQGFDHRYPDQLSGGQQQRVAIARALAVNPSLLLLDEPLSALDARVRAGLRQELREVQQRLGIPTLMVTHDQEEAMSMADKIVCMNKGQIEQIGSPRELYLQPHTRFVADFMGHSNLLPHDIARILLPESHHQLECMQTDKWELCVRPERITLHKKSDAPGRVTNVVFLGSIQRIHVTWMGQPLLVEANSSIPFHKGEAVEVTLCANQSSWVRL